MDPLQAPEPPEPDVEDFSQALWEMRRDDPRYRVVYTAFGNMSTVARHRFIKHTHAQAEKGLPQAVEILRRVVARKLTDV